MDVKSYLQKMLGFYTLCAGAGFSQIHNVDNGKQYKVTTGKEEIVPFREYELGFIAGKVCWITKARAQVNQAILIDVLDDVNDAFLLTLKHTNKYMHIWLYDRFGQVVTYHKMKYVSLNWFKFNPKKKFYNNDAIVQSVSKMMTEKTRVIDPNITEEMKQEKQAEEEVAAKISEISDKIKEESILKFNQQQQETSSGDASQS